MSMGMDLAASKIIWRLMLGIPVSPIINNTAQPVGSPNPVVEKKPAIDKDAGTKLKRQHATAAIAFYQKIIDESIEQHFPPTLFGFEYNPTFFTALKGYVVSAVAAIGYFSYSSFLK